MTLRKSCSHPTPQPSFSNNKGWSFLFSQLWQPYLPTVISSRARDTLTLCLSKSQIWVTNTKINKLLNIRNLSLIISTINLLLSRNQSPNTCAVPLKTCQVYALTHIRAASSIWVSLTGAFRWCVSAVASTHGRTFSKSTAKKVPPMLQEKMKHFGLKTRKIKQNKPNNQAKSGYSRVHFPLVLCVAIIYTSPDSQTDVVQSFVVDFAEHAVPVPTRACYQPERWNRGYSRFTTKEKNKELSKWHEISSSQTPSQRTTTKHKNSSTPEEAGLIATPLTSQNPLVRWKALVTNSFSSAPSNFSTTSTQGLSSEYIITHCNPERKVYLKAAVKASSHIVPNNLFSTLRCKVKTSNL